MEQIIQSKSDITGVYAENDEMALGAVTALKAAGKKPGKDVKIVSIDGTRNAVQAIVGGTINAVIESNPRFGPLAFATATKFFQGESIPENRDHLRSAIRQQQCEGIGGVGVLVSAPMSGSFAIVDLVEVSKRFPACGPSTASLCNSGR